LSLVVLQLAYFYCFIFHKDKQKAVSLISQHGYLHLPSLKAWS
jgi:hypothetical protein